MQRQTKGKTHTPGRIWAPARAVTKDSMITNPIAYYKFNKREIELVDR